MVSVQFQCLAIRALSVNWPLRLMANVQANVRTQCMTALKLRNYLHSNLSIYLIQPHKRQFLHPLRVIDSDGRRTRLTSASVHNLKWENVGKRQLSLKLDLRALRQVADCAACQK